MGQTASALPEEDQESLENYQFYTNQISSRPDGAKIDDMHKTWFGNWDLLEVHHSYIQWIFPIREGGLNFSAQPLSKHEASLFRQTPEIIQRIIKSYELMLDFYGLVLKDKNTGEVARNPNTFKQRYAHLNNSFHNYLRITRILKCLGIVGLEHFKKPFLKHMVLEVFKHKHLHNADVSCLKFWIPTLRKVEDIEEVDALVSTVTGKLCNRQRYGPGDEEGSNWSTQLYDPVIPTTSTTNNNSSSSAATTTPPSSNNNNAASTTTTIDVETYPSDPFEEIHKKFESTSFNTQRGVGRFGGFGSGLRNVIDDDDDDDDEEGPVVIDQRRFGRPLTSASFESDEDEEEEEQADTRLPRSRVEVSGTQDSDDDEDQEPTKQ